MQNVIRIIGIDPGLQNTGWGVIDRNGSSLSFVASGTVKSVKSHSLATRLCQLYEGLMEVVHEYKPDESAVEQTFVNKDAKATLKLGQARGIALLVPATLGHQVAEYAPNQVKKCIKDKASVIQSWLTIVIICGIILKELLCA